MQTVTLAEAQKHLQELVRNLPREGELLITDADKPVARLSPVTSATGRASLRDLQPASIGAVLRVKCRSAVVKSAAFWPNCHHQSG